MMRRSHRVREVDVFRVRCGRCLDQGYEEQSEDHSDEEGVEAVDEAITHNSSWRAA
ncbi:MAG: hypothetical protein JF563_01310 [Acidobacteriales bacterium]|nr:hypothetical protein [Terriglobales bacterium]